MSLLELSTVGLVICAMIVQVLWWSKPLDVQSSTPIPVKSLSLDDESEARIVHQIRVKEERQNWTGSRGSGEVYRTKYKYKMRVNNDTTTSNRAILALPIVGVIFGSVHLLA